LIFAYATLLPALIAYDASDATPADAGASCYATIAADYFAALSAICFSCFFATRHDADIYAFAIASDAMRDAPR
jgi:hypothetical protein